jgi:hypothetical protein
LPENLILLIVSRVLPVAKQHADRTPMLSAFLNGLIAAGKLGVIDIDITHNIFRDVVQDLVEYFDLRSSASRKRAKSDHKNGHQMWRVGILDQEVKFENSQVIARLLKNCLELGLQHELRQACQQVIANANLGGVNFFHSLWIPLPHDLSTEIQDNESFQPFQHLFITLLLSYIANSASFEPTPPKDRKRPIVSHHCKDCVPLNAFLADATRKEYRFPCPNLDRSTL